MSHNLELLAPAGTVEVFEAAVTSGADAVYIGAPMANARALAKHFSFEEIAAMVDFAHRNEVKVYVAMNSLVTNEELASVIQSLSIFEGIGVDAVILQDLGIFALARKYFPKLRLHASTLLGAHNSLAVRQMAEMGFSRIVLAREMSIPEIMTAGRATRAELEVFVHGAMCFSYSGLCLASSFLGGKSGLRGRCVQPCRRKYSWRGKHRGSDSGYFFSMNDLNGVTLLGEIEQAGVNSLKIEGRMRSLQYITNVVKAYRTVIDNGSSVESIATAQDYLKHAMSRNTSTGFFALPDQTDIITPHHSGNIGIFMGRIEQRYGNKARVNLHEALSVGDRLRIHHEGSGERNAFTVKELWLEKRSVGTAAKRSSILIEVPETAKPADSFYKVDTAGSRSAASQAPQCDAKRFKKTIASLQASKRIVKIIEEHAPLWQTVQKYSSPNRGSHGTAPARLPVKGRFTTPPLRQREDRNLVKPALPLWLKVDGFRKVRTLPQNHPFSRIVVLLTHESFAQFRKGGVGGLNKKMVIWALPPIIFEENLPFYGDAISQLVARGFNDWQIGHFSQIGLFGQRMSDLDQRSVDGRGGRQKKKARAPGRLQRQIIHGGYTLNVLNSITLAELSQRGVKSIQIVIEADRQIVASIGQHKGAETGVTVYGFPSLLTARASLEVYKNTAALVSPKGESFILKNSEGVTQVVPQEPFSLLGYLAELHELGIDYGVVDLTNSPEKREQIGEILGRIAGKHKHRKLSSFNYNGKLL